MHHQSCVSLYDVEAEMKEKSKVTFLIARYGGY